MFYLSASDRVVSAKISRALVEVRDGNLFKREGHARWSEYLRAFVPMTQRWCQDEMKRERRLAVLPGVAAAFADGRLNKSRVKVILPVVTPETEGEWLDRALRHPVRELEVLVGEDLVRRAKEKGGAGEGSDPEEEEYPRPVRHVVMAPPAVAVLVAQATEVARKVAGYHIGVGTAAEMMAAETFSGMSEWPDPGASEEAAGKSGSSAGSILGDHDVLVREMGRGWADVHEHMETISNRWSDLPWDIPEVILDGAPGDDAGSHERVVFWTGVLTRLDAVRGRLLRIMQDRMLAERMRFAGLGQYARERAGLTAREAEDLIRLDRELSDLPITFKMYAAGRLGRCRAWQVAKAVRLWGSVQTERAWVRYALTHSRRLLEAAVEAAVLLKQADPARWRESKGLPPSGASFPEVLRMCSLFETKDKEAEPLARIEMRFHPLQKVGYEATVEALRCRYGPDRPEWWCLEVMARHFLEMYAGADDEVKRTIARQVIQRDAYTCGAPECLMRGGLEADHIKLLSRGGPTTLNNMTALCVAHHRYHKHVLGSLVLSAEAPGAPDALTVKMGSRLYQKDELLYPKFDEAELDKDPWKIGEPALLGGLPGLGRLAEQPADDGTFGFGGLPLLFHERIHDHRPPGG